MFKIGVIVLLVVILAILVVLFYPKIESKVVSIINKLKGGNNEDDK